MFSTKRGYRAVCFGAFMLMSSVVMAQESHLTLDDIDKLARQKLVDSMRKTNGAAAAGTGGIGLAAPLGAPAAMPAASAPKFERKPVSVAKRVIPATFVGAYSDMSGAYVLYDYQGTTYTARQGTRLLNGWTVASVDGFVVNLVDGKRKWTETIAAPSDLPPALPDSPGVRAITDLGSPLPPGGIASASPVIGSFGK